MLTYAQIAAAYADFADDGPGGAPDADRIVAHVAARHLGRQASAGWAIDKFGRNPDVDSSGDTIEDIWNGGGLYTGVDPTAAEPLTIASSSTQDAADGTGMRTIRLEGLDANGLSVAETVTMNGTSTATTSTSFLRMPRAYGVTGGATGWNEGDVTVQQASSGDVMAVLPARFGQTQIAATTIPAGVRGVITHLLTAASNNMGPSAAAQEATVVLATRDEGSSMWRVRRTIIVGTAFPGDDLIEGGLVVEPMTDVVARVLTATGDNLTVVARFTVFLFPTG